MRLTISEAYSILELQVRWRPPLQAFRACAVEVEARGHSLPLGAEPSANPTLAHCLMAITGWGRRGGDQAGVQANGPAAPPG